MEIKCTAWNPSKHENMCQDRWLEPECYKDPVNAMDHAINLAEIALKVGDRNPNVKTTIRMSLEEYRLLISDAQRKAKEEGCKEGREEAWDLARRIAAGDCYSYDEVNKVFGKSTWNVLKMPVEEVLAKDKEYQEEKEALHIGDEVEFVGSNPNYKVKVNEVMTGYVIGFVANSEVLILTNLGTYRRSHERCEKTGKHNPDIEKVMASFEKGE